MSQSYTITLSEAEERALDRYLKYLRPRPGIHTREEALQEIAEAALFDIGIKTLSIERRKEKTP